MLVLYVCIRTMQSYNLLYFTKLLIFISSDKSNNILILYNNRTTPYKEYVEALRSHLFIPKNKADKLQKVNLVDYRNEMYYENMNSETSFDNNKKEEYVETLRSQFFIPKTETENLGKVKIVNSTGGTTENTNSDPSFGDNKGDFQEDNSYTLAVVRVRRKLLRGDSSSSGSSFQDGKRTRRYVLYYVLRMYACRMYVCMYVYVCMYLCTCSHKPFMC